MKTVEIKEIEVIPFSVTVAGIATALSLIIGLFQAFPMLWLSKVAEGEVARAGFVSGVSQIVVLPVVTFIVSLIVSALFAVIYNYTAKKYGGIKIKIE